MQGVFGGVAVGVVRVRLLSVCGCGQSKVVAVQRRYKNELTFGELYQPNFFSNSLHALWIQHPLFSHSLEAHKI